MTRQTAQPLTGFRKDERNTTWRELVRTDEEGYMLLDPPYQRRAVWTYDQQVSLIRSLLTDTPIPTIILNDRSSLWWTEGKPASNGEPFIAVVDGQQRIRAGIAWFAGDLLAPASWFEAEYVLNPVKTDDGFYVAFTGLARPMQNSISFTWTIPVVQAKVATMRAEAEIFVLVNGGGTPQTDADMTRAQRVAEGK